MKLESFKEVKEIWKDSKGYEEHYQISNFGKVKSLDRITIDKNNVSYHRKGISLKPLISKSENFDHALKNGLILNGSRSTSSKLNERKVIGIKLWFELGYSNKRIAKAYNISRQSLTDIKMNRTLKHVS